jgi:hypothetical protein
MKSRKKNKFPIKNSDRFKMNEKKMNKLFYFHQLLVYKYLHCSVKIKESKKISFN